MTEITEMLDTPPAGLGERQITIHNAVVRSAQGLTLAEKRIVMAAISKLDSRKRLDLSQANSTRVTAAEYAELADCSLNAAYKALREAGMKLYERSITFKDSGPAVRKKSRASGKEVKPRIVMMRWVGQLTRYEQGEGWIELFWTPQILPYLTGLQKRFTTYKLQQASAFRSLYSWRLLEQLEKNKSTGLYRDDIEDFHHAMEATPSMKKTFGELNRKAIQPALKELREKDGWLIEMTPIRGGKRVKAVEFRFAKNPQKQLELG